MHRLRTCLRLVVGRQPALPRRYQLLVDLRVDHHGLVALVALLRGDPTSACRGKVLRVLGSRSMSHLNGWLSLLRRIEADHLPPRVPAGAGPSCVPVRFRAALREIRDVLSARLL